MQEDPISILRQYWGFDSFKGSQKKIIDAVLDKRDVLALLPTGGGKSVCFQVPAMAQEGLCIVISPLIALIQDQVEGLKKKGIKAIALTGGIPFNELIDLLDNCLYGGYKFVYLSPERLQQELVQEKIRQMNVNLVAIDEAHCISQWGHDFRPAYLECAELRKLLPQTPVMALTATATDRVADDIVESLHLTAPVIVTDSFARKNIAFKILWEQDKHYRSAQLCSQIKKSGIVYVGTRRGTVELAQFLNSKGCSATFFHGGITKKEKEKKLDLWLTNKIQIMVATNAFGMGVDKPDVSLVVHYQIPDCLENYYQEAGRAGRDGQPAEAVLITNPNDEEQLKNQFLSVLPDTAFLKKIYNKLNNYFRIGYGEGSNETFQFNFNEFVRAYSLNSFLAYNGLKILDRNSVVSLSESFSKRTIVQFISGKDAIFDYLDLHKDTASIIQTILRTYGGIFDFETKINPSLIAKKTNTSEQYIFKILDQLKKDDIITYEAHQSDLEITFLVPREDDLTINVFAKKVQEQNRVKTEKVYQMIDYIKDTKKCRSKQILEYFGEKNTKDCGICDVCLAKQNTSKPTFNQVSKAITTLLLESPHTSRALANIMIYKEPLILRALQLMLEDGAIEINTKNEYRIK
ncbi:RecQ family ATP-dependent DNA helicase [Zobellia amurskyensis]|uniref:ATP-dependent DNA helicase RecQ n=1 Tax=Zobellia amurskyensis TaxID=248905 RepID=A0A7X2ZV52_9FLAO|nr:RecQ family ATP-dependent DNA helicase [Zobellia amurskyensis]MUH36962.1 RecQ family ATP-dependent DNA helicase [Zobellia amurskyensis]